MEQQMEKVQKGEGDKMKRFVKETDLKNTMMEQAIVNLNTSLQ